MRVYPSIGSHLFGVLSIIICRSERDGYPQQQRGSQTSEEPSFIQSNSETEMKETTAEQKRSAYLRACTLNASTNDNLGYLK